VLRARGVQLSPRGSVQDVVLREVVYRERFEEYTKYNFLGQILALAQRVPYDFFKQAQEKLKLAIFQTAYDPEAMQQRLEEVRRVTAEEYEARRRDARLLASVEEMTEKDDEEEKKNEAATFTSSLARRRTPNTPLPHSFGGVTNPWGKTDG